MEILRTLQVVFGIGLVIFVHEAGHFIAARLCKVRVEVFSLGFGPRLIGWRRGSTQYQIAAVPLGGYVKMGGEAPDGRGGPAREDDLHSKSVGQRFFIYSGGVLMNVVFALIAFPMVFAAGVPVTRPIIGTPAKGMPAWQAGLPAGTEILSVEGEEMFDFTNIYTAVALADPGALEFSILKPGAQAPETVLLQPERDPNHGIYRVGVRLGSDPGLELAVAEGSPAHAAGLRQGDRLVSLKQATDGPKPEFEHLPDQLLHAMANEAEIGLAVEREGEKIHLTVRPDLVPFPDRLRFGFTPLQNQVQAIRANPDLDPLDLVVGERITHVGDLEVSRPSHLLQGLLEATSAPQITIQAEDGTTRVARFPRALDSKAATKAHLDLHLTFDPDSTLIETVPGQAIAEAGLMSGDRLTALGGISANSWEGLFSLSQKMSEAGGPVTFSYERRGPDGIWRPGQAEVEPRPTTVPSYGFDFLPATMIYRTESVGASIKQGVSASWRFLADTWLTLKKMALGRVSTSNVGGIITIGQVSYSWASEGWAKLFFFLCILSINLAFLNVLPIPVLDGGHLFFCVVEAIKGSPVSERTLGYSQVVGLVVILTLMVYVTYQDVLRIL